MKIKRYLASSMEEALQDVKEELGQQAIILQTLRHKPLMGLFGKEKYEVVAATDAPFQVASDRNQQQQAVPAPVSVPQAAARAYGENSTIVAEEKPAAPEVAGHTSLLDHLLAMGFQEQTAKLLLDEGDDPLSEAFAAKIAKLAAVSYQRSSYGAPRSRTLAFIGATGSGKTTTLARLAADCVSNGNRHVVLITMDTSRVGAVEQLRSFAEILQATFHVAYTGEDLQAAIERSADADLILIDTPGIAPRDAVTLGRLRQALRKGEIDEIHLVMPVSMRLQDARRLYEVYRSLSPTHLVLTKLDETQALGGLLEIPKVVTLPVSYITYGQRVPEDMELATVDAATRRILACLQSMRSSG